VHYIDAFMFNHSLTLTLLFCLVTILHKINITSVVYGVNFYFLYRASFYQNRCILQAE